MKVNFDLQKFIGEAVVFRTQSTSRPGVFHYTFKLRYGGILCTCEGWQHHGHCKHVTNLDLTDAQEVMATWHRAEPRPQGKVNPDIVT